MTLDIFTKHMKKFCCVCFIWCAENMNTALRSPGTSNLNWRAIWLRKFHCSILSTTSTHAPDWEPNIRRRFHVTQLANMRRMRAIGEAFWVSMVLLFSLVLGWIGVNSYVSQNSSREHEQCDWNWQKRVRANEALRWKLDGTTRGIFPVSLVLRLELLCQWCSPASYLTIICSSKA